MSAEIKPGDQLTEMAVAGSATDSSETKLVYPDYKMPTKVRPPTAGEWALTMAWTAQRWSANNVARKLQPRKTRRSL